MKQLGEGWNWRELKIGDRFEAGPMTLVVGARLTGEPDGLSRGFAIAPRVLVRG